MRLNNQEKQNLIGKTLLRKYKITSWWRDGGLSSIFNVEDVHKNQNDRVNKIVKVIKLETTKNSNYHKAYDELKLFKNNVYSDRHLVNLYDYYIDDNFLYLILERIEGRSLEELLKSGKVYSPHEAVFLIRQLVKALKIMHTSYGQHPMIHRDIKPQNIIVDQNQKLTLIDFGISTMYDNDIPITDEGDIFCSPLYSCPDILKLNSSIRKGIKAGDESAIKKFAEIVSIQLDTHSIGVILYQMLTGRLPFQAFYNNAFNDAQKIGCWKKYDIPLISKHRTDVPITIDNIIYRCTASLENNIDFRYKDDNELEKDLENCLKPEFVEKSSLICPDEKRNYEVDIKKTSSPIIEKTPKIFTKKYLILTSVLLGIVVFIALIITILALATNVL